MATDLCLLTVGPGTIATTFAGSCEPIDKQVFEQYAQKGVQPQQLIRTPVDAELQAVIDKYGLFSPVDHILKTTLLEAIQSLFCAYASGWNAHLRYLASRGMGRQRDVKGNVLLCAWTDRNPARIHGYATLPAVRRALEQIVSMKMPDEFQSVLLSAINNGWTACEMHMQGHN
jgi:hypothetical protein